MMGSCSTIDFCVFFPVVKYHISVYTGELENAGTSNNVYLSIHGQMGNTGKRPLRKSINNENKFNKGQVRTLVTIPFLTSVYRKGAQFKKNRIE